MKAGKIILLAMFSFLIVNSAYSWDGIAYGKILRIDVADTTEGFRVILEGGPVLCNGINWAYVSRTQPAYQTYVSVLLAAQLAGKSVTVYSNKDANGYCQVGYVIFGQ